MPNPPQAGHNNRRPRLCGYDDQKILAEDSRDRADIGEYRAFLVSDIEQSTDQSRVGVDQENRISQCMGMAGLTVYKGNMAFDINAEDSRDRRM